jgi:hypothetical protein
MAIHACSPVATPRIIGRSEELDQGEWLGKALRDAEAKGLFTDVREGFDRRFHARAARDLENMLPMEMGELQTYSLKRGWLKLKNTAVKGVKEAVPGSMNAEEAGYANALYKVYLEGRAGGVKQLADNFMLAVNAGENATVQGLQFAQEMQGLSRFGSYVLGWDQQIGRGLRQSGLTKGLDRAPAKAVEGFVDTAAGTAEANLEYADKFKKIAALLADPTQADQGVAELIGLAKQVQFLEEPHKISKAVLGMEAAGNAWQELFVNGLLSSPTSFVANVLGAMWVPTRAVLQYGAAETWAMSGMAGSSEARIVAAEAAASLSTMWSAMNEALQIGWHAFKTETSLYQVTHKGITAQAAASLIGKDASQLPSGMVDTITRVGDYVRLPSRALLGTDEFAKHLAIRGEVAARGIRRAAREGVDLTDKAALQKYMENEARQAFLLSGSQLTERSAKEADQFVARLRAYDSLQMAEGAKAVSQIAAEATFQEPNQLASGMNSLLSSPVGSAFRPFIPFVRTPLNIIKQGFFESTGIAAISKGVSVAAHNPTKAVWAIQQELLKDPAETARIAGQIALTTSLGFWMYTQAMSGRVTGGGPGRWTAGRNGKAAQDAWVAAGNVPYSIRIGDQAIPFDRFGEPVAIALRMFSDLGMYAAYMDQTEQEEVFSGMVSIAASGLYQASFLQGVETLMKVGQEDSDYALGQAVQNYAATQTPFGGLLAFVDRVADPYKGAYQGASFADVMKVHEDTFGTGIFGKLANRIPGLGTAPQLVDQLTGRPVPVVPGVGPGGLNPLQMAIPIMPRNNSTDAVWKTVWDIKGSYIEKRPPFKLSAKEQQQLNGLMATAQVGGKTLGQRILEYRNRAEVQQYISNRGSSVSGTAFGVERGLDKIITEHYQQALEQLLATDNDVMLRARLHEAKGLAAENNNIEDARSIGSQLDDLYQRARRGY